jgi:hypothetical protein
VRKRRPSTHKIDKELARTWLVTVINPILEGLRREKTWLARGRWTWDTDAGRFAHLWPAAAHVEPRYRDNFDAFLEQYPEARGSFAKHDGALLRLAAACEDTVAALLTSDAFAIALERANHLAGLANISLDEARGAVPAERWPKHLAEYVVNNVESLPSHYTSAEFWQIASPVLLETRASDSLHACFEKVKQTTLDECVGLTQGILFDTSALFDLYKHAVRSGVPDPRLLRVPNRCGDEGPCGRL